VSRPSNLQPTGDEQNPQQDAEVPSTPGDPSPVEVAPDSASPDVELPPEARGEANGGPLGCCLGVMVGLLLSLILVVISRLYADPLAGILSGDLSLIVRSLLIILAIAGSLLCGYLGWKLGKRFYREYNAGSADLEKPKAQ